MTTFILFLQVFANIVTHPPLWAWMLALAAFAVVAAAFRSLLIGLITVIAAFGLVAAEIALFWAVLRPLEYGYGF